MSFQDKLKPVEKTDFRSKMRAINAPSLAVPERSPEIESRARMQSAQEDQQALDKEASKGFFSRFGSNLVKNIAPSQVNLGNTIAGIIQSGSKTQKGLNEGIQQAQDLETQLLKQIRENEAKGIDTSKLRQAYADSVNRRGRTEGTAKSLVQLPTNVEAGAQIAGTAFDVLTAGTYGKAKTAGMQTGRLQVGTPAVKSIATATGVPELSQIATQKAGGLFTKRGVGNIAAGGSIGYTSDVIMGMQGERGEERTGAQAFIPGFGTLLGVTLPLVAEATQTINNIKNRDARIADKRNQALTDLQEKYVKVDKAFKAAENKGVDVKQALSETNLLNGAVDSDGKINVDTALSNFDEFIAPFEGQVRTSLAEEGNSINVSQLADEADRFIKESNLPGAAKDKLRREIESDLKGFLINGQDVPLTTIHDTKVFRGSNNNYLDTSSDKASKEAARFFKEIIESNSKIMDVKSYNDELSKFYAVRDGIKSLSRTRVSGGRLGKYFASTIGTMVGASAGGPLGAIAGAEVGARIKGSQMERSLGGQVNKALQPTKRLFESMKPTATGKEAIPELILPRKNQEGTLDLSQSSLNSVGNRNSAQTTNATTPMNPNTVIPTNGTAKNVKAQGGEMFAGAAVGFEQDEEGNFTFDPEKAVLGMAGVGVAGTVSRSQAVKNVAAKIDTATRDELARFVTVVKGGGMTTTNQGKIQFKAVDDMSEKEAQQAFEDGLRFLDFDKANMDNLASQSPGRIASFYEEILQTPAGTKAVPESVVGKKPTTGTPDPDIKTKREVIAKDVGGNKVTIPEGTVMKPIINEKGQAIITVGGKEYTIPKNQYDNLKGQSDSAVAIKFAPELEGTEVTIKTETVRQKMGRGGTGGTTYSQYTLPGGEDYREIIVQAPVKEGKVYWDMEQYDKFPKEVKDIMQDNADDYGAIISDLEKLSYDVDYDMSGEILGFSKGVDTKNLYRSSHWEEPNPLFHLRMNDRTWDGKKVTFMEELQSDWAKDLRDGKDVPSNDLLKNWQIPATKKALMDAVDRDADIFAWINGAQTSERYKLSTQVDSVDWIPAEKSFNSGVAIGEPVMTVVTIKPNSGGTFDFGFDKTGKIIKSDKGDFEGKMLDEVLGKGMADSIMSKKSGTLEGEGLNFGGEWANNLYDRQVRDIVKKLTGAEVKSADMGLGLGQKPQKFIKQSGRDAGGSLSKNDLNVGLEINEEGVGDFIITDVLEDGKFKAISVRHFFGQGSLSQKTMLDWANDNPGYKQDFDLTQPKATQQYIELTPEVKAKIRSEAPKFDMPELGAVAGIPLIMLMLSQVPQEEEK